ncbi:MAG: bifunctional nuclease domain-containing protein, partial [Bacteroidota bacterium]
MKTLIDSLGGDLVDVTINDLREGTFFAQLNLDSQEIDSRPSDAIALAVRYGVPIFVAEKVMEEASFVSEGGEEDSKAIQTPAATPPDAQPKTPLTQLEQLQKNLEEAILKEEYERAAQLRDEIKRVQAQKS